MRGRYISTFLVLISVCTYAMGQTKVEIYPNVQRYLNGEVSELDRTIFFNSHNASNDTETTTFRSDYDVYSGRGFWGPFSYAKSKTSIVGSYPTFRTGNTSVRKVNGHIATEHPANVARYSSVDPADAGAWAANYYKYWVDDAGRPKYFEPMNEPFVHANDDVFKAEQPDDQLMREHMAKIFKEVGKSFHASPELANMKVIGYSSAWPSVELWDFGHWDTRMKMFMDVAGEHMDAFATHLYDGINIEGANSQRSGSNADAILDLIETYSYTKWGKIVPHAISELGGIEKGYGDDWSEIASIQSLRSINHIIMGLLEREDRMEIAIPFITGKAEWHITEANSYQPYGAVLWIPAPDQFGKPLVASSLRKWVYSPRIRFYQLWSEVKGKRVGFSSDNPDIQVQAFADGKKLYLILSNLSESTQTLDLKFSNGLKNFESLRAKRLKIYDYEAPVYTDKELSFSLPFVELIKGETAVLEYSFSSELEFDERLNTKNYYTSEHLKTIVKDQNINFSFNAVDLQGTKGKAKLFLSIGRKHTMSKSPIVLFNGQTIEVPTNWAGYDQANRDDFFGRLEIPVDYSLLQENNTVNITFPDDGGRISSLILNVEDILVSENPSAYPDMTSHPIEGRIEAENYDADGKDIAYYDLSPYTNEGGFYRTDGVDIFTGPGNENHHVQMQATEWIKYSVSVEKSGLYSMSLSLATTDVIGGFTLFENNSFTTDTISFPGTGSNSIFNDVETQVYLSAGTHELKLQSIVGDISLDYLRFTYLGNDSIEILNPQQLIAQELSYPLTIKYKAVADRSIRVSLFRNTSFITSNIFNVKAGTKDTTIEVTLSDLPEASNNYVWLAELQDSMSSWANPIVSDYLSPIRILVDSIDENSLPKTFKADLTTTVPVSYQSAGGKDLVIQLYQNNVFITETIKKAEQGVISEYIDLSFETTPKAGNNYVWKVYIVKPGLSIDQASAFKVIEDISIEGEQAFLTNAPTETSPSRLYMIDVPYEAFKTRMLVLELWKGNELLGSRTEVVVSGARSKLMPLPLSELPVNGNDYQWKIYITPLSGEINEAINADSIQNVIISDGTAIREYEFENKVELYPNPSQASFHIKLKNTIGATRIKVFDTLGRLVLEEITSSDLVELNSSKELKKGIYLIQVYSNGKSISRKLVIE